MFFDLCGHTGNQPNKQFFMTLLYKKKNTFFYFFNEINTIFLTLKF
jgi:hypothetical protein